MLGRRSPDIDCWDHMVMVGMDLRILAVVKLEEENWYQLKIPGINLTKHFIDLPTPTFLRIS